MPKQVFTCDYCAQPFTPLPNNKDRQKCCGRKGCRRGHRQEYQRAWHKARYKADEAFRTAAKVRVKRQRQRKKVPPAVVSVAAPVSGERLDRVALAVLGLAVQLGEDDDPGRAVALVESWADRGARLGISRGAGA